MRLKVNLNLVVVTEDSKTWAEVIIKEFERLSFVIPNLVHNSHTPAGLKC